MIATLALALGATCPVILTEIYRHAGGGILQFSLGIARSLVLDDSVLRPFVRVAGALLYAPMVGLLFGIPLGLLARRHLLRQWVPFLLGACLVQAIGLFAAGHSPMLLVAEWTMPGACLNMFAILGIACPVSRLRRLEAKLEHACN